MTRRPKKSETLELRLSHEDKEALKERAASEGSTVSDVVRSLISDYIGNPDAALEIPRSRNPIMLFLTRPLTLGLAFIGGLTATALMSSTASAENALIHFSSMHLDEDLKRTWSKHTSFVFDRNQFACKYIEDTGLPCDLSDIEPGLLAAKIGVLSGDPLSVKIEIVKDDVTLASDTLVIQKNSGGRFAYKSDDGYRLRIFALFNDDPNVKNPIMPPMPPPSGLMQKP